MPDADRFERVLKGKGWRRAYRLASGNSPIAMVVNALINAAAHGLREQVQCPSESMGGTCTGFCRTAEA